MSKKFVSLIGFPRSGTTLIARNLAKAVEIQYWEEPKYIWKYRQKNYKYDDCAKKPTVEAIAYIRERFDQFLDAQSVFLEKTPSNVFRIDYIKEVIPGLKMIYVFRKPLDVLKSYETKKEGPVDWTVVGRRLRNRDFPIIDLPKIAKRVVLDIMPWTRKASWGIRLSEESGFDGLNEVLFYWIVSAQEIMKAYNPEEDVLVAFENYIMSVSECTSRISDKLDLNLTFDRSFIQNNKSESGTSSSVADEFKNLDIQLLRKAEELYNSLLTLSSECARQIQ